MDTCHACSCPRCAKNKGDKPCFWHILGSCTRDKCPFKHVDNPTAEQRKAAEESRSRSTSPTPKKGPCADFQAGKCQFGDRCKFSHDTAAEASTPAPQAKANAKAKAQAGRT